MATDNKVLGEFELVGIPPAPCGLPQIEVSFDIDANGIVKERYVTIHSSGGLGDDEIERMVKEAEQHAQKDQERKALIDTKNTADTTIYSIEKSLREYREKIPAEIAKEIEDDVANKALSKIGQHMSGGASGGAASDCSASCGGSPPEEEEGKK